MSEVAFTLPLDKRGDHSELAIDNKSIKTNQEFLIAAGSINFGGLGTEVKDYKFF